MDGRVWRTRRGRRMIVAIRERVVEVMAHPAHVALRQDVLAKKAGVSLRTFRDYLTEETLAEAGRLRMKEVLAADLLAVDRVMFEKALEGHVGAARLVYARVAGLSVGDEELPTLEELEAEIARLKKG